jgi:hypothetical protein
MNLKIHFLRASLPILEASLWLKAKEQGQFYLSMKSKGTKP